MRQSVYRPGRRLGLWLLLVALPLSAGAQRLDTLRESGERLFDAAREATAAGEPVPAGALPAASAAISANPNYEPAELGKLEESVRFYLNQLALPPQADSVTVNADGFRVGETVGFEQVLRPGVTLGEGAVIMAVTHWSFGDVLQNIDPSGRNHVRLDAGAGVVLEAGAEVIEPIKGSLHGPQAVPVWRVVEGEIAPGSPLRFRYGNVVLPVKAYSRYRMPLAYRRATDPVRQEVAGAAFPIAAGDAARIRASLTGVDRGAALATVTLRFEDRFGNLASGQFPSLDVLVDGDFVSRVEAGPDPTPVIEVPLNRSRGSGAGESSVREVEIRSAGGGLRARVPVDLARSGAGRDVRWVELHAHTDSSDALATAPEVRAAFLGVTDSVWLVDHDDHFDQAAWSARLAEPGVDGFQWSAPLRSGGHVVMLGEAGLPADRAPRLQYPSQPALAAAPEDTLTIAIPEVPADPRGFGTGMPRLVEIVSGAGTFEWYGQRFAARGQRIGFTGSATSHFSPLAGREGRTAVQVRPDESLWDALRAGRTWVTTGPRIMLDVAVNGTAPGGRAAPAVIREISGRVQGTAPVERIELIRNGEVIAIREPAANIASDWVRVELHSASAPIGNQHDLPRNGREWIGFLRLSDGSIAELDSANFVDTRRQAALINPGDPARADFITWTRGARSSFRVRLEPDAQEPSAREDNVAEDEETAPLPLPTLEIVLRQGREDADQAPLTRAPANIPPTTMVIGVQELRQGSVTREYAVDGYQDTVTLTLVDREVPTDASFSFTDRRPYGAGDYYYVRVVQSDDHRAISSPVWVGGFDPH